MFAILQQIWCQISVEGSHIYAKKQKIWSWIALYRRQITRKHTINNIFTTLSPPQQHAVLYTGPTIHYTDTHSHKEGTRACNLSNSLMSRKQWREAKCYVTWLLETGSPAKTYRWGHDDVISGYRHHSRVTAQIFSYNHSGRLNVTFSDTISLEWTEKKHKRWYIM